MGLDDKDIKQLLVEQNEKLDTIIKLLSGHAVNAPAVQPKKTMAPSATTTAAWIKKANSGKMTKAERKQMAIDTLIKHHPNIRPFIEKGLHIKKK